MKILVVGAGAVGQVYGYHLARAGHAVSFFVKPAYAPAVRAGLTLHRLRARRVEPCRLQPASVLERVEDVAATRWDQVWLALPSDALRGDLARQVLGAVGGATVVCLQPGIHDGDLVRRLVPPAQVVQGLIPFISFQSPLPGCEGPEGIAYWLPPMPTLVGGDRARADAVIRALRAGGLGARYARDFAQATAPGTALFQCLIATLEAGGWRLREIGDSPVLEPGMAAAREALAIAARGAGGSGFQWPSLALRPWLLRLAVPVLPRVFPFDIEVYLEYHFSKVGQQTRDMLDDYIRLGAAQGQPHAALRALRAALPALD